jgi:hypothetical protein
MQVFVTVASNYRNVGKWMLTLLLPSNCCHVFMSPRLIITCSGLDDWIYRRLLCTFSLNHNQLQELTINLLPRTRSILVLILILSVVRRFILLLLTLVLPQQYSYNFWTPNSNSLTLYPQTDSRYTRIISGDGNIASDLVIHFASKRPVQTATEQMLR